MRPSSSIIWWRITTSYENNARNHLTGHGCLLYVSGSVIPMFSRSNHWLSQAQNMMDIIWGQTRRSIFDTLRSISVKPVSRLYLVLWDSSSSLKEHHSVDSSSVFCSHAENSGSMQTDSNAKPMG